MKKRLLVLFLILLCSISFLSLPAADGAMTTCDPVKGHIKPATDEVLIGPLAIAIPINKILLVRKDKKYCAVKFTKNWKEENGKEKYTTYELHYQKDGTGVFLNKNVEFWKEKASFLLPRGFFYTLIWQSGSEEVKCEFINLVWDPWCDVTQVCFFEMVEPPGDYGIELAPTPWTDIKDVNVIDPRVKWYRYDENRKRVTIPIDKLWEAGKGPEQKKR